MQDQNVSGELRFKDVNRFALSLNYCKKDGIAGQTIWTWLKGNSGFNKSKLENLVKYFDFKFPEKKLKVSDFVED